MGELQTMKSVGTPEPTERVINEPTFSATGNYMDDCSEPTGPQKVSAQALRTTGRSRASSQLILFCTPRGKATSTPADVALRNHCVLSYTNKEAAADDQHQPTCLATHEPATRNNDSMQSWLTYCEARGFMSLRMDPSSAKNVEALVSVLLNTLTIYTQSSPSGAFNKFMVSIPVEHLILALRPGQFELLVLLCLTDNGGEIVCCCKDKTARNVGVRISPCHWRRSSPVAWACSAPVRLVMCQSLANLHDCHAQSTPVCTDGWAFLLKACSRQVLGNTGSSRLHLCYFICLHSPCH